MRFARAGRAEIIGFADEKCKLVTILFPFVIALSSLEKCKITNWTRIYMYTHQLTKYVTPLGNEYILLRLSCGRTEMI